MGPAFWNCAHPGAMRICGMLSFRSGGVGLLFALVVGVGAAPVERWRGLEPVVGRLDFETIELRRTGDNHLYRSGRVNGQRRSCLVDTGWSFTTLQAGKTPALATLERLEFGRVAFTNQPVRVENIVFNGQPAAFDLVLGLDFLRANFAVLDFGGRRLFTRAAPLPDEAQTDFEQTLRRAGFCEIALQLKTPLALTFAAQVNGESVEMLLDSGAAWTCLDQRQCARLKLKPLPSATKIIGAGKTGGRSVAVTEVKSLQLGGVGLPDVTLALFDLADWGFAAPEKTLSEVQGILGGEWLAATSAVIDCHRLRLWVKPPTRR